PDSPNVHWPLPTTTTTTAAPTTTTTTLPLPPHLQQGSSESLLINHMGELEQHIADRVEENQVMESRLDKQGSKIRKLETMDWSNMIREETSKFIYLRITTRDMLNTEWHMKHYRAQSIVMKKGKQESPKPPPGSPPSPPPPPPPPSGASGASGTTGASEFKNSPRAVTFRDRYGVQMIMRFNEIHKFSDGTLQQIDEALDYRVKEFQINRTNPGMNTRFWTKKDVDRSKDFMFAIQKRLKTRRIFRNLESFVGGRIREGDYRLLKRTE
ncbi:hypothetical protein Tco_0986250, partial [Tanacetum coccineum]